MRARSLKLFLPLIFGLALLSARHAAAQDEPDDTEVAGDEDLGGGQDETESKVEAGTEAGTGDAEADAVAITGVDPESSPKEKKGETYLFVGAHYRLILVPKFMMTLFGADPDGGRNVVVHGIGPEFGIRKDDFEYNLSIWYADYSMDPTPFKAKDDPVDAWEHVESDISVIYLTADFLWSAPFNEVFAFTYGLGAGIGFPFGPLHRTEVFPGAGATTDPETWSRCQTAGQHAYCDEGPKEEPTWANGGSKPIVFPWLVGQIGLRIKPHRNFVARIDLFGFGTSGFWFGLALDYGL